MNMSLFSSIASAQSPSAGQLLQQGVNHYQVGNFAAAIADWEASLTLYQREHEVENVALVLENLARAYQASGKTEQELQFWEQAASVYRQAGNPMRVGRVLMEEAQTYSRLGQYRRAVAILCGDPSQPVCSETSALGITQSLRDRDRVGEVIALGSLGDAYRLLGRGDRAIQYLEQGLAIAETINEPTYLISTLNSLGNAHLSLAQLNYRRALLSKQIGNQEYRDFESEVRKQDTEALHYLQRSFTLAQANHDSSGQTRALISTLQIYYRSGELAVLRSTMQQALQLVALLPSSQEKVYASIDLARFLQLANSSSSLPIGRQCASSANNTQVERLLKQAIATAQQISDQRSESFALGELGHFYECQSNYEQALVMTRQAVFVADQALQSRDSLYLWQWQTGRIFKAQKQPIEAIRAYDESIATLESLRKDILTNSRDVQFDFRETVEPIYRELVELRLQQEQPSVLTEISANDEKVNSDNISLALNTLDSLKLAELQNYFGNDCVLTALSEDHRTLPQSLSKTAVFSTAILGDRVAVILTIQTQSPTGQQQKLQQFEWIKDESDRYVDQATIVKTINEYRQGLEAYRDRIEGYDHTVAERIYNWMIRPFEPILKQNDIQTLIFVQDGIFRSVPMAALHDGHTFLIENYAIAVTPSLKLTNLEAANRERLRALAAGFTQKVVINGIPYPALTYVESELKSIQTIWPQSVELRDQNFTLERFEQAVETERYPIIHIATHGKFSTEAENAFLVTGASPTHPDQKLTLNLLDTIIRQASSRNPVELLVLSACQTAAGDDRAALGLAGIAAQAGAKRVLASLWSVNDRSTTDLIIQFYQGLKPELRLTQAQALQAAQLKLLRNEQTAHPAFWSAFILIGNWL
jgi:CHAT domain-containing protein